MAVKPMPTYQALSIVLLLVDHTLENEVIGRQGPKPRYSEHGRDLFLARQTLSELKAALNGDSTRAAKHRISGNPTSPTAA